MYARSSSECGVGSGEGASSAMTSTQGASAGAIEAVRESPSPAMMNRGKGPPPGHASRRAGASPAATTTTFTPAAARIPAARTAGLVGFDRHVGRTRTEDAVDSRYGLDAFGQPQAHAVSATGTPARQTRRDPVRSPKQLSVAEPRASLILHGQAIGPPGGGLVEKSA